MTEEKREAFKFSLSANVGEQRVLSDASDPKDIADINKFTLKPITAEDVAVFRMDLCNDLIDTHVSRFPREELKHISAHLVVGKPVVKNHDVSVPATGRFFRSQIAITDGVMSVQPDLFILRNAGDDDTIKKIEAGVLAGTSISFACDRPECSICKTDIRDCGHWPGDEVDGELCHVILRGVSNVFEGSIVPLGAQGTEFIEARAEDGESPTLPLREALKLARGIEDDPDVSTEQDRLAKATDEEIRDSIEADLESVREVSRIVHPELVTEEKES